MRIKRLLISNYRNLDNAAVYFDDSCNFIVGENNLGKSNLLALLNTIFCARAFNRDDFKDTTKLITIKLQIKLAEVEIGQFTDLFSPSDPSLINIVCQQSAEDEDIEFLHEETGISIHYSLMRNVNYIHYNSLRNPITEINFDKGKGVGRFLSYLVSEYLKSSGVTEVDFLDNDKMGTLVEAINNRLSKIKTFTDFGILAKPDDDLENLLLKVLVLKDDKGDDLLKTGYGIQFLILVTLSILDKIQHILEQRKDKGIFQNKTNGEKSISIVLGLDEPEIHLHPYMQRSLIRYLNSIINNNNTEFNALIKDLFGIDKFIGQILVVTHSPNVLLNDYRQIIRFYSEHGTVKIISGTKLNLEPQIEKHLHLNFPFFKEAFFCRSAILVEGDSEYGCIPLFAHTLSLAKDLDDYGVGVIQANGDAIPQLLAICSKYGIPSIGITDKDDGTRTISDPNHLETHKRDFEEEIVTILVDSGKENLLRQILCNYDVQGVNRIIQMNALNKRAVEKYGVTSTHYTCDLVLSGIPVTNYVDLKSYYLTWLNINKSNPLGRLIGEKLTLSEIPMPYRTLINEAFRMAMGV